MVRCVCPKLFLALFALTFPVVAAAQGRSGSSLQRAGIYDLSQETVLEGTVVAYTANAPVAPLGAQVMLQTSSGIVAIHLGNARLLQAAHLELAAGDAVKIVGEMLYSGNFSYFAARVVAKGSQTVAVRNTRGLPLPAHTAAARNAEALRGVQ